MSSPGPLGRVTDLVTATAGLVTSVTGLVRLLGKRSRKRARVRVHRVVTAVLPRQRHGNQGDQGDGASPAAGHDAPDRPADS